MLLWAVSAWHGFFIAFGVVAWGKVFASRFAWWLCFVLSNFCSYALFDLVSFRAILLTLVDFQPYSLDVLWLIDTVSWIIGLRPLL